MRIMVSQILAKNFTWNCEALCQHKLFSALATVLSEHSNRVYLHSIEVSYQEWQP